jgi:hypothetical protein
VEVKAVQALDDSHVAQGLKSEVRRLGMGRGKGPGDLELDVRDVP